MIVKELIAELQKYPEDMTIVVIDKTNTYIPKRYYLMKDLAELEVMACDKITQDYFINIYEMIHSDVIHKAKEIKKMLVIK